MSEGPYLNGTPEEVFKRGYNSYRSEYYEEAYLYFDHVLKNASDENLLSDSKKYLRNCIEYLTYYKDKMSEIEYYYNQGNFFLNCAHYESFNRLTNLDKAEFHFKQALDYAKTLNSRSYVRKLREDPIINVRYYIEECEKLLQECESKSDYLNSDEYQP